MGSVVAVDVGGTSVKAALVSELPAREILQFPTPPAGGQDVVAAVISAIEAVGGSPEAIGLAVPGIVDETAGEVRQAKNLGWEDLPLAALVGERFGLPVGLGHDVRAAALAEYQLGAGQGADRLVFVGIGTGISAAVLVGGRPLNGSAGEIGHGGAVSGDLCACGGRGCLESYASAAAIARRYAALTGQQVAGAAEVAQAVSARDRIAQEVWDDAVAGLARELAGIVRLLGEVRIVIGGGLSLAGPALLDPLRETVQALLTVHPAPEILPAAFGDRAGIHGAAMLARRQLARHAGEVAATTG
ncbi:MAG: ROK family protein [Propionibacteriaceae bacterium]|jgi:glucokinase|nr:ROK family protein [Propionibacteriaceae bacterium]